MNTNRISLASAFLRMALGLGPLIGGAGCRTVQTALDMPEQVARDVTGKKDKHGADLVVLQ